jgi:hypothetical protein
MRVNQTDWSGIEGRGIRGLEGQKVGRADKVEGLKD